MYRNKFSLEGGHSRAQNLCLFLLFLQDTEFVLASQILGEACAPSAPSVPLYDMNKQIRLLNILPMHFCVSLHILFHMWQLIYNVSGTGA